MKHRVYLFTGLLLLLLTGGVLLLRLLPGEKPEQQEEQSLARPTGISSEKPALSLGEGFKARGGDDAKKTVVRSSWPARMQVNQSSYVSLALNEVLRSERDQNEAGYVSASPQLDFGRTDVPIQDAFGPDYDVSASADLVSAAFDIKPIVTGFQAIENGRAAWEWSILPKNSGKQSLTAVVVIQWKHRNTGDTRTRQLWSGHLPVKVKKPVFTLGQIDILALITGSSAIGFVIRGLVKAFEKRYAGSEDDQSSVVDVAD